MFSKNDQVNSSQAGSGQPNLRNQKTFKDCAFTFKLNLYLNKAVTKKTSAETKTPASTVKIEPKYLTLFEGNWTRVYESTKNQELDYQDFVDFAAPYCGDKIIGEQENIKDPEKLFNDHSQSLRNTVLRLAPVETGTPGESDTTIDSIVQ